MNKLKRVEIFTRLRNENPHPTTELAYGNPFQLLVAVILSAQSTDVGANKTRTEEILTSIRCYNVCVLKRCSKKRFKLFYSQIVGQ